MKRIHKIGIVAASVLGLAGGGIAYASIPDSGTGVYHACVKDAADANGHMVRMIDAQAGEACSSGWTEKTWPGIAPSVYVVTSPDLNTFDTPQDYTVSCTTGDRALSGGWHFVNQMEPNELSLNDSNPTSDDSGWHFNVLTTHPEHAGRYVLYAVCTH